MKEQQAAEELREKQAAEQERLKQRERAVSGSGAEKSRLKKPQNRPS